MNWSDAKAGAKYWHRVYVHLGVGTVIGVVATNPLARLFERGERRVRIQFENEEGHRDCKLRELVKRPDKVRLAWWEERSRQLQAKQAEPIKP